MLLRSHYVGVCYVFCHQTVCRNLFQISTDVPVDVEHASIMIEVDANICNEGLLQDLSTKTQILLIMLIHIKTTEVTWFSVD